MTDEAWLPSPEEILCSAVELPVEPVAIEAAWDGDTVGWWLELVAVYQKPDGSYWDHHIAILREEGGDIRLFEGLVPQWPEAELASIVGPTLAARFGVPFHFPAPPGPDLDCPRWWEREDGEP